MEVYKFYNDKIEIEYEDRRHTYTVRGDEEFLKQSTFPVKSGTIVPSATGVVDKWDKSDWLTPWAVGETVKYIFSNITPGIPLDELELEDLQRNAPKARYSKRDKAIAIGNLVHDWLHDHIAGRNPVLPNNPLLAECVQRVLEWEERNRVQWLLSETKLYSNKYSCAGTADAIALVNGIPMLIDYKTSPNIYMQHWWQTAFYYYALNEMGETPVEDRLILHINKTNGKTTPHLASEENRVQDTDFMGFLGLRMAVWASNAE